MLLVIESLPCILKLKPSKSLTTTGNLICIVTGLPSFSSPFAKVATALNVTVKLPLAPPLDGVL